MSKRAYGQALRKGDEEIQLSELMWHELLRLGLSFAFGEDYLEHEEEDNHRDSTRDKGDQQVVHGQLHIRLRNRHP